MGVAFVLFGRVEAPALEQPSTITRYRWPIRFRFPWL
jgi:hypothetical protein